MNQLFYNSDKESHNSTKKSNKGFKGAASQRFDAIFKKVFVLTETKNMVQFCVQGLP